MFCCYDWYSCFVYVTFGKTSTTYKRQIVSLFAQEQWTYSQGIFFSVVTFLTIGFGDFFPTKAATQIVLFPFALIGIVQIAALVDLLVRFFRSRVASRHANRRNKYERRRQDEQDKLEKEPDLEHELRFLRELYRQTNHWKTMEDLAMNSTGFVSFWIIGALIFSQIEVTLSL